MSAEQLMPCPFCGGTSLEIDEDDTCRDFIWCLSDECRARLPYHGPQTIATWNRRAPAQQGGEVVGWGLCIAGRTKPFKLLMADESPEDIDQWKRDAFTVRPLVYGDGTFINEGTKTDSAPVQPVGAVDGLAALVREYQMLTTTGKDQLRQQCAGLSEREWEQKQNEYWQRFKQVEKAMFAAAAAPTPPAAEPVAWVDVVDAPYVPYTFHVIESLPTGTHKLYTHPPASPADAVDAGRYRFIRDGLNGFGVRVTWNDPDCEPMKVFLTGGRLDREIDKAMAQGGGS